MTIDEIVTLIQAVSDNGLTSFVYEEGDQKRNRKDSPFLYKLFELAAGSLFRFNFTGVTH